MDTLIPRYCLSLLLFISIAASVGSNETIAEEPREPRVSGRIVKLYSGVKPDPFLCTAEGFQADPNNCASFYRCVKERSGKFTVFRYQCAPGTVYDPDVETCNHARNTRRTECGGTLAPTAEPHHTTNINEIEGAQSELPRPISTRLPIYTEQTTTPSWILSTERQNPTKMPWTTLYSSPITLSTSTKKNPDSVFLQTNNQGLYTTQGQWELQYASKLPPKITQSSSPKNNDPCTSDGFMGDSENCRKFYRCVGNQRGGYVKYEFSCSESTVWDDEIQGCNHPWAVKRSKCGRSLSYNDKSSSQNQDSSSTEGLSTLTTNVDNGEYGKRFNKTIQQQLQISHGSKVAQTQTQISHSSDVIQNQTQINNGEREQNSYGSKSKQNQTQISYGTAVSQSQTQIDYGNKGVQTQLQINHSKDASQSQIQIIDSTTQSTKTTAVSNNSNNECSESGFMGDSNDCKKFYRCVNNGRGYTKYEYFCGDGTVWDPEIEACNHAWAVKECGGKHPAVPSATEKHTTTSERSTEYHSDSTKTTQSYITSHIPDIDDANDVGYGNQNNQDITTFSTSTKATTTTPKSTTQKPNGIATECMTNGFMGDVNDCKVFYRCVDNGNGGFTKYEFKCGDGTVWDPEIEACNHAWAVKNCGGSTSSEAYKEEITTKKENSTAENVHTTVALVQITTQVPTQGDDYDTGYGSQNNAPSTISSSSSTTSKPVTQSQEQENNNNSVCKSSGFMGDEKDCKKFYRCVDNGNGNYIKYEFTCGQGTVWDSKIDACNHAWAVEKCGGSNNISESSDFETTSHSSSSTSSHVSTIQTTQITKETDTPTTTTSSTNNSSSTDFATSDKCLASGFMGDSTDCKKFYRCVDNGDGSFTRYEFSCGQGTVWDPKIEACNHAWAVEKCGGGSSVSVHEPPQTTSQHPVMLDEEQDNGYATPNYSPSETTQSTITSTSTSSTTSSNPNEMSHCTTSGFMGDKNDCKKFYRCVDNGKGGYDRYEFHCGEGTVWDEEIEACNHDWAVTDCRRSGSSTTSFQNESTTQPSSNGYETGQTYQSTEKTTTTTKAQHELESTIDDKCKQEGFYGNKYNCKKFYRCVDNGKGGFTKYEFTCGEGTSWNQDIQGCDHISPNKLCSNSANQEPTNLFDDMDTQTSTTSKTTTSRESNETQSIQTTKPPLDSKSKCDSEGFYANPTDCKKFYRCVENGHGGYTKYDFSCGDGTMWNQEIQACDHESADKSCSSGSSTQTQTSESQSESTSSSTTTKKEETTDKTETSENIGGQCTSEGFFSHPNNCKKFIRCVNNGNGGYTRYEFSCGDGTVWVQEIQACDHDNDVNSCGAQVGSTSQTSNIEDNTSSTTSSSLSSTHSIPSNDEYDNQPSEKPSHDETDDCTSEGYFANKQDCRKFYRCVDNGKGGYTKYDFICGEGTAWDSDLQTCDHMNNVQSCSGSTSDGNGQHETTTNKNQAETESSSSTTKATTSAGSSSSSNNQDKCESEGYFGDSKDCKKFYRCVDNGKGGYTKYDYTCGDGTIWDQDLTTCNHPQDVSNPSCGNNQGSSDSSSTTSSSTSSVQSTSSTTEGQSSSSQGTSDCSEESSKKPTNNNVTCNKAGYYANPNDCKKFYRCVDWDGDGQRFSVFHFECGEGTIWDPALDTCNHEDSVYPQRDCSQTQSQNVGGDTSTTEISTTTTIESTTSKQTTQESTSEPTTATSEQTTTESSTTEQSNESTTTQETTSEKTTTQESTTSEQTTTQQATTSEQTTTQQTTTSETTTTEQTTTNDQTTTQQSTTSEQTTTQQSSTSSETTTTEQTTTSEHTTTEQSTTSEQTTTQQSTGEQTTTQQSTTSEQTTTQQSTTDGQTTTQQSTTEESTMQESTTNESTTNESSTTEQSTTEGSNEQTTTQQSTTTEQSTTQQPTTTEQTTTQESTTSEQTESTSEQTTTQQSTTSETSTTEQSNESTTEQSTTTTEQTTDKTTTTDSTTDSTTTEDTTDQSTTQTSSTESDSTEDSSTTTEGSFSDKECPETEDDQYLLVCPTSFRRHPKYCNMFYQCTEDDETSEAKVAMFKCPNNTIYDESQTQCVTEDKADKKCDGEIANKRRFKRLGANYKEMIVADKGKHSCPSTGYFSFEKHSECAKGFLKCEKSKNGEIRGYVYQCPDGYIYWSISKRCERIESVRDCKRSSNDWTGRWNIPVESKNVASR